MIPDVVGGRGYVTSENTAQGGTATTITPFLNTETANSSKYVGMRVVITAGTGAGQYAQITSYNPGTKVANVAKESRRYSGLEYMAPQLMVLKQLLMLQQLIPLNPRVTFSGGGGTGAQVRAKVSREELHSFIVNRKWIHYNSNDYYRSQ